MASSTISCSNFNPNSRQRKHNSTLERKPLMLKDFLHDDSNSCSSNRFKSFPRKSSQNSSIREKLNYGQRLQRSRSKAASTTISAFQGMINAVKNIHFASSIKSPSILLPGSLSRKLSKTNSQSQLNVENKESEIKITLTVKDIVRWKSFRDLVEEKSRPSDFASSPHHCTTTITTTTGSNTPCRSNGSSWCDSEFTSEYFPSDEYGESEVDIVGKKFLPCVGKDPMEKTTKTATNTDMGSKCTSEEKEQHSPLSVLDFEYEGGEDDEDSLSSFNQSLAIMERTKKNLVEKIHRFKGQAKPEPVNQEKWMSLEETNEIQEKAWHLLNRVKETSPLTRYKNNICIDKLVLDLFREEIETKWDQIRNDELEQEMVKLAKAWIDEEHNETTKWGVADRREDCVRDMEREGRWMNCKFHEEQEELAMEVERWVTNILVDELLVDLL